jgi:transmembrane sensor
MELSRSMAQKTAREINTEAAAWAIRLDEGLSSREEEIKLEVWLAEDVRHPGALARMRAFNSFTWKAKALAPGGAIFSAHRDNSEPDEQGTPEENELDHDGVADERLVREPWAAVSAVEPPSRRALLRVGGTIAATAIIGTMIGWETIRADKYRTGRGDTKVVALKDGSVIKLNTESEIAVDFSDRERAVQLIRGEATFDVTKAPAHPFTVAAGDTRVRVVGTSFTVQRISTQPIQVLVRQGIVEVSHIGEAGKPVIVKANMRAVTPLDRGPIATNLITSSELQRELAWQSGHIAFEGQTLAQAVTEFSRYSDIRIVIADPALANEEIVGLFLANDPIGFAKTIAVSLNARVAVEEGRVVLSR